MSHWLFDRVVYCGDAEKRVDAALVLELTFVTGLVWTCRANLVMPEN